MNQNREKPYLCRRLFVSLGIAAALGAAALQAADTIAYTVTRSGQFGTVDLNTGVFTPGAFNTSVGPNGFGIFGGALYWMTSNGYLQQVNTSTGAVTTAPNPSFTDTLEGFGSSTAGLFLVDSHGNLNSVNAFTGTPTLVGPTGVTSLGGGVLSTSADSANLYWVNNVSSGPALYRLNTSTGAATLIGATGNGAGKGLVQSMLFEGGTLWASLGYNTGPTIGTLSTSTAAETFVTNAAVGNIYALAPFPLTPVVTPSASRFVPVTPCRIADTRNAAGPFGGPGLPRQTSRDFAISNSACGIPSTAVAYSLNVAVVPSGTLGFLTLWPTGQPQPLVATLNSIDGRIKSNAAIVPAGLNGAISVFVTDATDVILDINGYFVPASNAGAQAFYPVTPCRVADTRNATAPLGGPSLAAQGTRSFPILASSCGVPASAQAYSLNFAAVPKGPTLGFMTAWPAGQSQPVVASLNDPTGTVLSNAVVVPAGAGGAVNVFTTDATDLVIDINGYFAPPGAGGLSLYTVAPCRVLDSRLPSGSPPFNTTRDVSVTGSPCAVPSTALAFVFNATVVPPGFLGYITMWPQGQTQPLAATLNAYDGAVTNNMAIVPTTTGSISVFPSAPTHLVLDIFGYFAP